MAPMKKFFLSILEAIQSIKQYKATQVTKGS